MENEKDAVIQKRKQLINNFEVQQGKQTAYMIDLIIKIYM